MCSFTARADKHARPLPINFQTISSDENSCIIPFNRIGNLIVLKAKVDTLEGNFILDTGAPDLVLNLTYFRNYPISHDNGAEETGIGGATSSLNKTYIKQLSFGSFNYSKIETNLTNLGNIENAKGIKVLGLLGVELFKQCELIIDFEKSLIYLHRISRKETDRYKHEMLNDATKYHSFSFDLMDNRIVMQTELSGKKLKLIVDCAAESNILDSRLPDKVFENVTITRKIKLTGAGDKKIDALYGSLNNLKLGNYTANNLSVTITNLEKTCFSYGGCIDGVLGFDFLSLTKVGFNFVNRKMYIWK
jgi:hypothetical protein